MQEALQSKHTLDAVFLLSCFPDSPVFQPWKRRHASLHSPSLSPSVFASTGIGGVRACWRLMNSAEILPLSVLKRRALEGRVEAAVHGQIDALVKKETRDGKPFWEMALADAE